jgi:2-methylcitrate dehydratase PrpD
LVRGRFGLQELEPASITDPDILALCAKVQCEHDEESAFPEYFSGQVEIHLRDGRRLERRERVNRGAAERPLSRQDIEAKFLANALLSVSPAQAEAVLAAVMSLEQAESLAALCAVLPSS